MGYEDFKKTGEGIKEEVEKKSESELAETKEAENGLAALANSPLLKRYQSDATRGSENIAQGKLPILKIFQANKSKNCELANGKEPNNGWFFYSPTQEQFEKVRCHILTISKGYRAKPQKPGDKPKFTQLVAGIITEHGEMKPFIMYMTGLKLQNLWDFGKDTISTYTHLKPIPIPMFALTVELGSEKADTDYGPTFNVTFTLVKEKNVPLIVTDEGEYEFLATHIDISQEMINNIIRIGSNEDMDEPIPAEVPPPSDADYQASEVDKAVEIMS